MRLPQPGDRWIWVSLPRATFAVVVAGGKVVDVAPYGRRIVPPGMNERAAAAKLRGLGAELVPLPRWAEAEAYRQRMREMDEDF